MGVWSGVGWIMLSGGVLGRSVMGVCRVCVRCNGCVWSQCSLGLSLIGVYINQTGHLFHEFFSTHTAHLTFHITNKGHSMF
jgi:hypothetical protein